MTTTYELYTNENGTPKAVEGKAPAILERVEALEGTLNNGVVTSVNGNTGDITPEQTGCLPLAGGTMTGTIVSSSNHSLVGASSSDKHIICGGTNWADGSHIVLGGKDSDYAGALELVARNGGNEGRLYCSPTGRLQWNGNDVITSAGGTIDGELFVGKYLTINTNGGDEGGELRLNPSPNYTKYGPVAIDYWKNHIRFFNGQSEHIFKLEQDTKIGYMFGQKVERIHSMGTNYIRYYGGLQICWGMTSNTGTWNFPQWFSENPVVLITPNGSGNNPGCHVDNITTTGASIGNGNGWAMQAIAIGKWG